jgi:hypothetical protein
MQTLIAFAIATPVWGFALEAPILAGPVLLPQQLAQVEIETPPPELYVPEDYSGLEGVPETRLSEAERHTVTMMDWTRGLTVATSAAMLVTAVLGAIQFSDEYGFHDEWIDTPCARGDTIFGWCGSETPWAHAIGAVTSAGLLISAFVVSTQIDYEIATRRDGDYRTYQTTRWIALGMGALQALAGFLLANSVRWDWLDERQDFDTLQGLAIGHMLFGLATFGMNTANAILLF